jgi:hypothetical protein
MVAIHVHDKHPEALAELITKTMHGGIVVDREAQLGPFSAVIASQEREAEIRRANWHWLNSLSKATDGENDWTGV